MYHSTLGLRVIQKKKDLEDERRGSLVELDGRDRPRARRGGEFGPNVAVRVHAWVWVWGLGCGVWGLGFEVWGLGCGGWVCEGLPVSTTLIVVRNTCVRVVGCEAFGGVGFGGWTVGFGM